MKQNFSRALDLVLQHEGGYVDHPSDPGGATNLGVTRKTLARWRKVSPWQALPRSDVKALTKIDVTPIYRAEYWNKVRGDDLPSGLDYAVFDYAVNSGPNRAIKVLQTILGVTSDGVIGPVTLAAVAKRNSVDLISALCSERMAFLRKLSTFSTFGKGWTSRINGVLREASIMAVERQPPAAPTPVTPNETRPSGTIPGWFWLIVAIGAFALWFAFFYRG